MAPHCEFSQDILAQRPGWEDLARSLNGTFAIHRSADRTDTRFTLTLQPPRCQVVIEASDLHRWRLRATGPCEGVSPFTLSPWDRLDSLANLLGGHRAALTHPDLPQTYLITGGEAEQVASVLASPALLPHLSAFPFLQASLRGVPEGFELALLTGYESDVLQEAPRALAFVDALLEALSRTGLLEEGALSLRD